ncbi:hypothetical protein GW17_00026437 [Ensete ventricosum]|nr:hypothetical protein GW17_00026437 [Ensete ventricosum]
MWPFSRKGASGFSWSSTAEEVTEGLDGSGLTAVVTGLSDVTLRLLLPARRPRRGGVPDVEHRVELVLKQPGFLHFEVFAWLWRLGICRPVPQ